MIGGPAARRRYSLLVAHSRRSLPEAIVGLSRSLRAARTAGVALAAVLLVSTDLGTRLFGTNDEARFPLLARDILARGDWLWPKLNGAGYYNKPPLMAWLIALVSWPGGDVTEFTAVVPSACAAVATALIVYHLGRTLVGDRASRFAALIAITTQGFFLHARLSLPDMVMTCLITASMAMFVRMMRDPRGSAWVGFYGFAGAAFWAKGPAGLLPLAVGIVYGIVTRGARTWSLRARSGLPLVAGFVGLWWLLGALSDTTAFGAAVASDHFLWYLPQAPGFTAFTEPIRNTFAVLFPWVLLAPLVIGYAIRLLREPGVETERRAVHFLLVWFAVTFVLVGVSHQQRLRYYVPVVPPMALLIGWWLSGAMATRDRIARIPWRAGAIAAGLLVAATVVVIALRQHVLRDLFAALPASPLEAIVLLGAIGVIVTGLIHGVRHRRVRTTFIAVWAGGVVWLVAGYHWDLEQYNTLHPYPAMAARWAPLLRDSHLVAARGVPELAVSFYFDRAVPGIKSDSVFQHVIAEDSRGVGIVAHAHEDVTDPGLTVLARHRLASGEIALVRHAGSSPPDDPATTPPLVPSPRVVEGAFSDWWRPAAAPYPFASGWGDLAWELVSVLITLIGLAIRLYTAGVTIAAPPGAPEEPRGSADLDTTGPYSVVRYPLCCATLIVALGLSLFPHIGLLPPLVVLSALAYCACRLRRDEKFLRQRFGGAFEHWATCVPAIVPRLSAYVRSRRRFDWRRALRREHLWVGGILVAPFFLDLAEDSWETHGKLVFDPVWTTVAVLGLAVLAFPRVSAPAPSA